MKRLTLILVACVFVLTGCLGAEEKFAREVAKEAEAVKVAKETIKGGYGLITVSELKELQEAGTNMLVVDTMPYEDSYLKGHIPDAVQFLFPIPEMPEWDLAETADKTQADYEALLGPDKDKLIVVYCGFVKCARSHNGAVWAMKLGYTNVKRLPGGIYAWKGAEYPVATGS